MLARVDRKDEGFTFIHGRVAGFSVEREFDVQLFDLPEGRIAAQFHCCRRRLILTALDQGNDFGRSRPRNRLRQRRKRHVLNFQLCRRQSPSWQRRPPRPQEP